MDGAVFLEIRERTQSGLLIIRRLKPESWPADITVLPSSLELRSGGGSKSIPLPPEVRIVPSSCRGLQYVPGDGLHMRLHIQADCSKKLMPSVHNSLKSKMSCTFYCQSCGNIIIPGWTPLRVLPLPDENWSGLVEEWCCHANPFHESLLQPQNGDCFLAHNYFLVNSGEELTGPGAEVLPPESEDAASPSSSCISISKTDSRIICKRCRTLLGEVMSSGVAKYYFTELFVQPSEDDINMIPRSDFIQSVVSQCLVELSAARSTFRFSIQATDGTVYILVWLLNSDTLLMESAGNLESSNVFTLLESATSSDSRSSEIWKAIKVLYHPCIKNRNKDLVDAWENDFGVHPLTFPSKTCLELLLILSQSNASLPPSLRRMDFFQVAFLKM